MEGEVIAYFSCKGVGYLHDNFVLADLEALVYAKPIGSRDPNACLHAVYRKACGLTYAPQIQYCTCGDLLQINGEGIAHLS